MDLSIDHLQVINNLYLLFFLFLLSPLLLFLLSGRRKADNGLPFPPGPFSWPIIGNIFNLEAKRPHISMAKLAEYFGPLISLRVGTKLFVVASNPTVAREIVKVRDREMSGRFVQQLVTHKLPDVKRSSIAKSPECDQRWRLLRGIGHAEIFSSQAIESHAKSRVEKVNEMLELLNSRNGQVVKITDVVFATVANVLTRMMVSQDIIQSWSQSEETQTTVRRLINIGFPDVVDLYPSLIFLDFWSKRKAELYRKITRTIWSDALIKRKTEQKHDAGLPQSHDFLDALIKNALDDNEIYNFLTELFVSSESITTLIEWAMAELTRNEDALLKLRHELAEATEGTVLRENRLSKLPYLQACIKETFRLHPPSPFLVPRTSLETCEVMNYGIPKNTVVVVNAYALGRDPMTWDDPLSFKPERFLNKSIDLKGTNYELLPFGGGRRICAGFPLALKQIQLVLSSLVHAFDWSLPPETEYHSDLDMSETFGITLRKEKQLLMIPRKRNHITVE